MTEGDRPDQEPILEISQEELTDFQNEVRRLSGKMKENYGFPHAKREYPIAIDGEPKKAVLDYSESESSGSHRASIQVIDATETDGSFLYWEIAAQKMQDGKKHLFLTEGVLQTDEHGTLTDPGRRYETFEGAIRVAQASLLRKHLDGEPIKEFGKAKSIIEQISREQASRPGARVKALARKLTGK